MSIFLRAATAAYRHLATRHPRALCKLKLLQNHAIEEDQEFWKLYSSTLAEGNVVSLGDETAFLFMRTETLYALVRTR